MSTSTSVSVSLNESSMSISVSVCVESCRSPGRSPRCRRPSSCPSLNESFTRTLVELSVELSELSLNESSMSTSVVLVERVLDVHFEVVLRVAGDDRAAGGGHHAAVADVRRGVVDLVVDGDDAVVRQDVGVHRLVVDDIAVVDVGVVVHDADELGLRRRVVVVTVVPPPPPPPQLLAAAAAAAVAAAAAPAASAAVAATAAPAAAAASAACAAGVAAGVVLAVADRREVERDRKDCVDVRRADALESGVLQRGVRVGCEVRARLRVPQQAHQEVEQCGCDVCHDQFPSSSRCESMTDTSGRPPREACRFAPPPASVRIPVPAGTRSGFSGGRVRGRGGIRVAGADDRPR